LYVNQLKCADVYVIAAEQLEFRVKVSACYHKCGNWKATTLNWSLTVSVVVRPVKVEQLPRVSHRLPARV